MAEIEIRGLRELRERMLALPKKLDRQVLGGALMEAAQPIRDDARRRAPVLQQFDIRRRPGTVQRAIRSQRARPLPGMTATVIIRVKRLTGAQVRRFKAQQAAKGLSIVGANNPNDPFYWWWLEFGTSKMAAQPFMRPAFEANKRFAAGVAKAAIARRVEAAARKYT